MSWGEFRKKFEKTKNKPKKEKKWAEFKNMCKFGVGTYRKIVGSGGVP